MVIWLKGYKVKRLKKEKCENVTMIDLKIVMM